MNFSPSTFIYEAAAAVADHVNCICELWNSHTHIECYLSNKNPRIIELQQKLEWLNFIENFLKLFFLLPLLKTVNESFKRIINEFREYSTHI